MAMAMAMAIHRHGHPAHKEQVWISRRRRSHYCGRYDPLPGKKSSAEVLKDAGL